MRLTVRQNQILEIIRKNQPITSESVANKLNLSRSALRNDLSLLSMMGLLEAKPNVGYYCIDKSLSTQMKDIIADLCVESVMSVPVVLDEKVSVHDGIVSMFIEDVGTLFVVSNGYLAGVISRKDFLKNILGNSELTTPIGMIMTRMPNIVITYPQESIYMAASKLIQHEIDSLPVVEKTIIEGKECHKILGRISKTTITRLFVDLLNDELGGTN
jgi:CBS domain-containing protein